MTLLEMITNWEPFIASCEAQLSQLDREIQQLCHPESDGPLPAFAPRPPPGINLATRSARFQIREPAESSPRPPAIAHISKDAARIVRPNHLGRKLPPAHSVPLD
jgi:hypothetical protein